MTAQDAKGFGGVVTCVLGGYLGVGQTAPLVTLQVELSPASKGQTVVNHASVVWTDPEGGSPGGVVLDSAVINAGWLASTGVGPITGGVLGMLALLLAGGGLLVVARRRSRAGERSG
jgi:hypothetical protein